MVELLCPQRSRVEAVLMMNLFGGLRNLMSWTLLAECDDGPRMILLPLEPNEWWRTRCTCYLNAQPISISGRPISQTFSRYLPQMSR